MKKTISILLAVIMVMTASVAFAADVDVSAILGSLDNENYSIVSSATGGLWYQMVGAAASLWSDGVDGISVSVEGTAGSNENCRRFANGEADFGMVHANHLVDSIRGIGFMEGNATDAIQVMCQAYDSPQYFITLKSSNIRCMEDLRGKKVVYGAAGSGASSQSQTALSVLGIEVNGSEMQTADAARELQEGRIDAVGQTGAFATGFMELAAAKEIYIIPYSDEEIQKMCDYSEWYFKGELPANVYQGQTEAVPCFSFPVLLCANKSVPEDVVYEILKVTFTEEGLNYLKTSHAQWDPSNNPDVVERMGATYHPGAVKFWAEQGK